MIGQRRFGYPAAPVVLGLLLGPIAEQGYAQALMIGRAKQEIPATFFGSTVSFILIACILASIFLPPLLRKLTTARPPAGARSDA
jgi:putative tricarboxylic transport membrane protein